ncbi:hypothetical protein Sjap_010840 [Stephania japonica]|uniref:U1-type domain-containing protein n=1 Tax=Stephania japonica TaxID=461633 RepID=A0AAP0JCD2_9MAGN
MILEQEEKKEGKLPIEALKEKFIFWCEDCRLGLHCESAIDSHLKGKKHMARLRAQKKVVATNATTSSHGISIMEGVFVGTHNNAIGIADGEANVASSKSRTGREEGRKLTIEDFKKKFKFWCKDCQIGCHNMVVMNGHLKGKKHMAQLQVKKEQCAGSSASATIYTNIGSTGKDDSSEEGFEEALDDFDGEQQIAFKGGLVADEEEEEVGKPKPTTSPNISGTKEKFYNVGDKKFIISYNWQKKKPKVWDCSLYKVSVSSEQALNEHLQEKKHLEKTYDTTIHQRNSGKLKGKNNGILSLEHECEVKLELNEENVKFRIVQPDFSAQPTTSSFQA